MSNPQPEVETTRDLRVYVVDALDTAIEEIKPVDEFHFDIAYAMLPNPQGMTLHGMIVFYFPSPVIGHPPITLSFIENLAELIDVGKAKATVRLAIEQYATKRAEALQIPDLKLVPGGPSMPLPGR